MIWIIYRHNLDHKILWSGSKKSRKFFDLDQKTYKIFLIWTKKESIFFWSGPKIEDIFFDLDQKFVFFFLIWIKKSRYDFWSGSKKRFFFDLDQKISFFFLVQDKKIFKFGSKIIKDHEIKKWSTVLIHDLPTVNLICVLWNESVVCNTLICVVCTV